MPITNIDRNPPMVGAIILEGYEVLANYRNQYVLAQSKTPGNPEPFVVWALDDDGDPHTGSYCTTLETATKKLFDRCCPPVDTKSATKSVRVKVSYRGIRIKGRDYLAPELIPYISCDAEVFSGGEVRVFGEKVCTLPL